MVRSIRLLAWLTLVAGSVAVAVWAFPSVPYPNDDPDALAATVVPVVERSVDRVQPVSVELDWSADRSVSLARDGLVTGVAVSPGSRAGCGAVVATIEGRAVVLFCAEAPLWRPITGTTAGPDADATWDFLRALGLLGEEPTSRAQRTDAIRGFRYVFALGNGTTIEPSDLVWSRSVIVSASISGP